MRQSCKPFSVTLASRVYPNVSRTVRTRSNMRARVSVRRVTRRRNEVVSVIRASIRSSHCSCSDRSGHAYTGCALHGSALTRPQRFECSAHVARAIPPEPIELVALGCARRFRQLPILLHVSPLALGLLAVAGQELFVARDLSLEPHDPPIGEE